jgi:hypothetical protein
MMGKFRGVNLAKAPDAVGAMSVSLLELSGRQIVI